MKTANELAQEYFAKTPIERVNTTVQDYVYDYQQAKIDQLKRILSGDIEGCKVEIRYAQSMGHNQALPVYEDKLFTLERLMEILK